MTDEQAERNLAVLHTLKGLRDELGTAQIRTKNCAERHKEAKADESEIEQQIFALLATLVEGGSEMSLPFDANDSRPDLEAIATALADGEFDPDDAPENTVDTDDPGPDPMDVAEADKDFSDHLATQGRSLDD